jgi:hypothetical protein
MRLREDRKGKCERRILFLSCSINGSSINSKKLSFRKKGNPIWVALLFPLESKGEFGFLINKKNRAIC